MRTRFTWPPQLLLRDERALAYRLIVMGEMHLHCTFVLNYFKCLFFGLT